MEITAIVLAAGKGTRFKKKVPKPLFRIGDKPILIYSLLNLSRHPDIKDIIVVTNSLNQKKIIAEIKKYRIDKIRAVVLGGLRRQDSVAKGLAAIDNHTDFVLIHDAARPFINAKIISSVIKAAKEYGAAISGVPVKATIKEIAYRTVPAGRQESHIANRLFVKKTLERNNLWEIQTPQVFRKDLILKAYGKFGNNEVTDDAALVERLGAKVRVVLGSYNNIKITTKEDLVIAEAIATNLRKKISV